MLETWEYVLHKTEQGNLVAIDLLDTSAAFDTLIHHYLMRKMEVEVGMSEESLEWLASYLKDWLEYVVVGASSSSTRLKTKGAPQGGGLSPNLFRGYLNTIPEAGLLRDDDEDQQEDHTGAVRPVRDKGIVSQLVDAKEVPGTEERHDKKMRNDGVWNLMNWRESRTGNGQGDKLKQKVKEDDEDVQTSIYADDTQSRAAAKTLVELERRNSIGLTKICTEMKSLRLKVNEDKTTYMVLATQGRRSRQILFT